MDTFIDMLPTILGCLIAALAGVFNYLTARRTGKTFSVLNNYLPKVVTNTNPAKSDENKIYVVLPDGSKVDISQVQIVKGDINEKNQDEAAQG